ncbi:MAG: DUF4082 domain-containing protein [Actinomycetia bacterium]|nr:DUF4082 domain-containing protein [Actinomycetes bacterium]
MFNTMALRRSLRSIVIVAMVGVLALTLGRMDEKDAEATILLPHGGLVPEEPEMGFPIIHGSRSTGQDGAVVRGADQVGRYIVAGGTFSTIELQDGTLLQQPYFAAFDIDTKEIVCPGQFVFDGDVMSIEAGIGPTDVFVGGRFKKVIGADGVVRTRNKVALIDLADCSVDTEFVSIGANGKITALERLGNRLFVGGDFTTIGGADVETIAELDATTGAVRSEFDFPTTDEDWGRVMSIGSTSDGTRLVFGGRFGTISGNGRTVDAPTAIIDISDPENPQLTTHESYGYIPNVGYVTDVSVSPDGSLIGVAGGKGTSADYVYLVDATDGRNRYRWNHYMRDSSFAIGVSDSAVYVGGHFCKIDSGPGASATLSPQMGFDSCTGQRMAGGVWRSQIAALSLADGTPLNWNPGTDAYIGHRELTVTTRGLLTGFDGNRVADRRVGSLAFFDFGPEAEDQTPPSSVEFTSPTAGAHLDNPAIITGRATDDVGVDYVRIEVQEAGGKWVQADGSLGQTRHEMIEFVDGNGRFELELTSPAGSYVVSATAVDHFLNESLNVSSLAYEQTGFEQTIPTITVESDRLFGRETRVIVDGVAEDNSVVQEITAEARTSGGRWVAEGGVIVDQPVSYPVSIVARALGKPRVRWAVDLGGFLPPDFYTVTVTVHDASGNSATASSTVEVADRDPFELVAALAGQTGGTLRDDGSYTLGYAFVLDESRELAKIGIRDANSNGVLDNQQSASAAVWRVSNRQLIAQTEIGPDTVRRDGWFYGDVDGTITLEAGVEYVVGFERFIDGEGFMSNDVTPAPIDGLQITRRAFRDGANGIVYPSSMSNGSAGFGMPNLMLRMPIDSTPTVTVMSPEAWNLDDEPLRVAVRGSDEFGVADLQVWVRHEDGRWLTSDGTLVAAETPLAIVAEGLGSTEATTQTDALIIPAGRYTIDARVTDLTGNTADRSAGFAVGPVAYDAARAIVAQTGGTLRTDNNLVLGYAFELDEPRALLGLAIFDADGNGINDNLRDAEVGLWRRSDRALLASVVVPDDAEVVDGWISANLDVVVNLDADVEYVVGFTRMVDGEGFRNPDAGVTLAGGVRITRSAWVGSTTLQYPQSQSAATAGYGSPNLILGVPRDGRPTMVLQKPPGRVFAEEPLRIEGTVSDNATVNSVAATLRHEDGRWLDGDGTLRDVEVNLPLAVGGAGTPELTFWLEIERAPLGAYVLDVEAFDGAGNESRTQRVVEVVDEGLLRERAIADLTGGRVRTDGDFTLGYVFESDTDRTVGALGIADADQDGVNTNAGAVQVGLWRRSDRALLATVNVPADSAPADGWFMADLAQRVQIEAGVHYVVGFERLAAGEPFRDADTVPTPAEGITIVRSAYASGAGLRYPDNQLWQPTGFGMPNIDFVTEVEAKPQVVIVGPTGLLAAADPVIAHGSVVDNAEVASIMATIQDSNGWFLQADGTFAATRHEIAPAIVGLGFPEATWLLDIGLLPPGEYELTVTSDDAVGNTGSATSRFTVTAETTTQAFSLTAVGQAASSDRTSGFTFEPSTPGTIVALGVPEANANGLLDNLGDVEVGLWRRSDRVLLGGGTLIAGTPMVDGVAWASLDTPVDVLPGVEYVVGARYESGGELRLDSATIELDPDATPIQVVRSASGTTAVFGYPDVQTATTMNSFEYVVHIRFEIFDEEADGAPIVAPLPDQQVLIGDAVDLTVEAVDPEHGVLTYAADVLPDGLVMRNSGRIVGTVTTQGTWTSNITVTDVEGLATSVQVSWIVEPRPVEPPVDNLACMATPNPDGTLTLRWTALVGEDNYVVRMNGNLTWYQNAGPNLVLIVPAKDAGLGPFHIRTRTKGVVLDAPCEPDPDVEIEPEVCIATAQPDGSLLLSWTGFDDIDLIQIRWDDNNAWFGSVEQLDQLLIPADDAAGGPFHIRVRRLGETIDTRCTDG